MSSSNSRRSCAQHGLSSKLTDSQFALTNITACSSAAAMFASVKSVEPQSGKAPQGSPWSLQPSQAPSFKRSSSLNQSGVHTKCCQRQPYVTINTGPQPGTPSGLKNVRSYPVLYGSVLQVSWRLYHDIAINLLSSWAGFRGRGSVGGVPLLSGLVTPSMQPGRRLRCRDQLIRLSWIALEADALQLPTSSAKAAKGGQRGPKGAKGGRESMEEKGGVLLSWKLWPPFNVLAIS